ncbi:2-oxo-4-hydroxy-4-carboxy-5-ureidoimidazoline decarboxylase [Rudaeicoccus suwonensis]|uniref:2-oxo-4-hydroxy-4-carboxy-5-ureidoimidazoline decarboxylase n=1 Tax=Rudaeicoccus suwonensis TaxID=657409 RepID=A0A561E9W3_9MICO|nr:2-oxo-4-hydroxy-4-carboxy-5-ureidoimidazoline decarboxylase [Rudaeicoccus suwonensis]TWE12414.1 2-oxo-4-hydroxy-4-carboxy-5-ureidoimidazoline decarboxylase [Rudaeicoccus suwonensis]
MDSFNAADTAGATAALLSLCASSRWATSMSAARPFPDVDAVLDTSDAVFPHLVESDLREALAGHPRIGDRVAGSDAGARLSRSEQASMADADGAVTAAIREGNIDYEQRFDRVFLIRAAGRTPQQMLQELQRRLRNDDTTELAEVREQLRQITHLRLEGALR